MEQQQHQHSLNESNEHKSAPQQQSAGMQTAPKINRPQTKIVNTIKRNFKRDGIILKNFSEADIDTLEEIAGIQGRTVDELVTDILQPQINSIVDNFQQMKKDLLKKAAADSFKTIKK